VVEEGDSVVVIELRLPEHLGDVLEVVAEGLGFGGAISSLHDDVDVAEDLDGLLPELEVVGVVEELESDVDLLVVGVGVLEVDQEGDFAVVGIGVDGLDDVSEVVSHGFRKSLELDLSLVDLAELEGFLADLAVKTLKLLVLLDDFKDDLIGVPEALQGFSDVGLFGSCV
jgi:hypothetical protein